MPELPEVEILRQELQRKLCGKKIKSVEVLVLRIVRISPTPSSHSREEYVKTARRFSALLKNKTCLHVDRRAKLLIFKFSGRITLLAHLKLSGQLVLRENPMQNAYILSRRKIPYLTTLPNKSTCVVFTFDKGTKLFFNDLRKLGWMQLVKDKGLKKVKELQEIGPEPLNPAFTAKTLLLILSQHPKKKIKALLMDQHLIAGIGNIYADEILFSALIAPTRPASTIQQKEVKKLWRCIRQTLKNAIRYGGSSVRYYVHLDGRFGDFTKFHKVYRRTGQSCPRCKFKIERLVIASRSSHFCPRCQK
jgi:formamidopyrimidine-DNA glycosylase